MVAVGGNALLERGEVPVAEIQEGHVAVAVAALARLAADNELVVTHGNGPQVGLLANESAADPDLPGPYPMDVLGAESQGMIGYFFLQALENALPGRNVVSLIGQTEVHADDPAFTDPTKFVGPVYTEAVADDLAARRGWQVREDGTVWRRVVPSPEPRAIVELAMIRVLVGDGAVVICSGGGGIPVVRGDDGRLRGAEAVIDKDLAAALLARELEADALLLLTDVDGVEAGFGTPDATLIRHTTVVELRAEILSRRLHGPQGGRRLPLRRGHGTPGHDRPDRGRRRAARGVPGHDRRVVTDHLVGPTAEAGAGSPRRRRPRDHGVPAGELGLAAAARRAPGDVVDALDGDPTGLTAAEAGVRQKQWGHNVLPTHPVRAGAVLLRQIRNPILILLLGAALVSGLTGGGTNAVIIAAIVVLSGGLGFVNEMAAAICDETGCIDCRFAVDIDGPLVVWVVGQWESATALEARVASPHCAAFSEVILRAVDGTVEFTRFELSSAGPLFA